ncbi:hypothetical protein SAMN05444377_10723 [Flavobacterium fontis]|uniref:Uncharacterized protein n=1 Tax=Flavobacterium fontis TaxID=1124188 RepID=A0A1M5AWY2_9FLAO|nr:hypothetical protein [Flavobacterium fontis]SHF34656.1 hypothetical protein SAMN05444377_10723 [Flavobacterium fontis]
MKILKTIIPFYFAFTLINIYINNEKTCIKLNKLEVSKDKSFKVVKKINSCNTNFYFVSFYSNDNFNANVEDLRTPPRLKQLLYIIKKNKKKIIKIPKTNRYQITSSGKKIKIVDIRIDKIDFYSFKGDTCFRVSGYGGCNSCNEFEGYYNLEGKIIYYSYRNKVKDIETVDNLKKPWDSLLFERSYIKKPFLNIYLDSVNNN